MRTEHPVASFLNPPKPVGSSMQYGLLSNFDEGNGDEYRTSTNLTWPHVITTHKRTVVLRLLHIL